MPQVAGDKLLIPLSSFPILDLPLYIGQKIAVALFDLTIWSVSVKSLVQEWKYSFFSFPYVKHDYFLSVTLYRERNVARQKQNEKLNNR